MSASFEEVPQPTSLQARVKTCVWVTWLVLFVLVWWRQLAQDVDLTHLGWAVVYSLPLLAPLPGLLQGKRYTYRWATLCVLPYFIVGATESVANMSIRYWALALLGASLLWFFMMIAYLRVSAPRVAQH